MVSQRAIGLVATIVLCVFYIYFTMWVMITPLIDSDQSIHNYFPHRKWAFIVPIYTGCVFLSLVFTFTGFTLIYEKNSGDRIRNFKNKIVQEQAMPSVLAANSAFRGYSIHN